MANLIRLRKTHHYGLGEAEVRPVANLITGQAHHYGLGETVPTCGGSPHEQLPWFWVCRPKTTRFWIKTACP
ncbi:MULTISPECIES: hypothetical protein [Moorena]|uniref:hypothetical protein n=1 Tax=Moorena TaxID=1155738 RepID=UPI0010551181|nr:MULTISPECIES: hypothetical protein [Moorena]NEQ14063.1 hypothetical protein [Moorena sp. SIO3E2]NEP31953.1 hypothetical protein [Moorena sp. SIO3B2]NEQ05963.1 hypothetical protein [Moorena sp. SIO4E2]NER86617.1 hypothetical protein [Moorena sp. SIO3A2]NET63849.1 hypothetical protein [Moorena sp. SIO1G6]